MNASIYYKILLLAERAKVNRGSIQTFIRLKSNFWGQECFETHTKSFSSSK